MAHLTINGVEVLCTQSEWEPVTLGEVTRSLNGTPRNTGRVRKADYRFTSTLLSVDEALAMRGLIEGDGHVVSFEDGTTSNGHLYTSREAPPSYVPVLGVGGYQKASGRFGQGVRIYAGQSIAWNDLVPLNNQRTYMVWLRNGPTGPWQHLIQVHNAASEDPNVWWLNGVEQPNTSYPPTAIYNDPSGEFCSLGSTLDIWVDDFVALPYAIPNAWGPQLYAFHRDFGGWPALPYVIAQGARIAGYLKALGKAGVGTTVPRLTSIGETVPFTLYGT